MLQIDKNCAEVNKQGDLAIALYLIFNECR